MNTGSAASPEGSRISWKESGWLHNKRNASHRARANAGASFDEGADDHDFRVQKEHAPNPEMKREAAPKQHLPRKAEK
jgi:hypothetical protein